MKTVEPDSTNTAPERMTKFIDIIYVKADLEEVADNSTQMNYEGINMLLVLINEFEDLFYFALVEWDTETIDL